MIETQPNNDAKMTLTLSTSSEEELRSSDVVESAVESHVEMQVADGVANAAKELGDKRESPSLETTATPKGIRETLLSLEQDFHGLRQPGMTS